MVNNKKNSYNYPDNKQINNIKNPSSEQDFIVYKKPSSKNNIQINNNSNDKKDPLVWDPPEDKIKSKNNFM